MEQQDNTPAEKEEKPDFEEDSILIFKSDGVQVFIVGLGQLQQEITTLRARIAELEKKQ